MSKRVENREKRIVNQEPPSSGGFVLQETIELRNYLTNLPFQIIFQILRQEARVHADNWWQWVFVSGKSEYHMMKPSRGQRTLSGRSYF